MAHTGDSKEIRLAQAILDHFVSTKEAFFIPLCVPFVKICRYTQDPRLVLRKWIFWAIWSRKISSERLSGSVARCLRRRRPRTDE